MFTGPPDDDLHPVKAYKRLIVTCWELAHLGEYEPDVAFIDREPW
jgi:hypothetical protein